MNVVVNPSIPYIGPIPKPGLEIGRSIVFKGTISPRAKRFMIDFLCCERKDCDHDIAFHISVRLNEKVIVRNSNLNGEWLEEERTLPYFRLAPSEEFSLVVLTDLECYKVDLNGSHLIEFKHRLPFYAVKAIAVNGDVKISRIDYQNTSVSPYGRSPHYVPPAYNPAIPFMQHFKNGFNFSCIRIIGAPITHAKRISIDFLADQRQPNVSGEATDIAVHFNVRFDQDKIVMNSKQNNIWQQEECGPQNFEISWLERLMKFDLLIKFDLIITINEQFFQFISNGKLCGTFRHRLRPISRITSMQIHNDLLVYNIQYS